MTLRGTVAAHSEGSLPTGYRRADPIQKILTTDCARDRSTGAIVPKRSTGVVEALAEKGIFEGKEAEAAVSPGLPQAIFRVLYL
jgi:hypothetical protein